MEDETDFLSFCNVCYVKFDLELFRPKVLHCSHTFCFRCLQTIHSKTTLHCPVCRAVTRVYDVAALPNNIYALHLINLNQQLEGALLQREQSYLQWCFSCELVVKPDCQEQKHTILDMSRDLKELNSKMKHSQTNLRKSLKNRRQAKSRLKRSLAILKRQVDEIKNEIGDNDQELDKLENMLETETVDFSKSVQAIEKRYKETKNALAESTQLTDDYSARLKVIKWTCTKSDDCSLRRKVYTIRSSTIEKDYLNCSVTKRTSWQNTAENKDTLVCFSFNPVGPTLACGYKSGFISHFVGRSHYHRFIGWKCNDRKLSEFSITSMDWNALGNEIAFGDENGRVKVLNSHNSETDEVLDLGSMCLNSRKINFVKWNGKCAPDLLAACSKNSVHVWDVSKPGMIPIMKLDATPRSSVMCMIWISSEMLAISYDDANVKIFQIGNLYPVFFILGTWDSQLGRLSWNPSVGTLAFFSDDVGEAYLWQLEETQPDDQPMPRHIDMLCNHRVVCLDWHPSFAAVTDQNDQPSQEPTQGVIAAGTREQLVVIVYLPEYVKPVRMLTGHTGDVDSVAYSPNGEYLASLSVGRELMIWSAMERDDYSVLLRLGVSLAFGKNITWSPCCRRITLFSENIGDSELGLEEIRVIEISEKS